MPCRAVLAGALLLVAASVHLAAIYMHVETRDVPIDRLVANLERALKADPSNVDTLINLARLHAMAFALKTNEFPAAQIKPEQPGAPLVSARVERDSWHYSSGGIGRSRRTRRPASQGVDPTL